MSIEYPSTIGWDKTTYEKLRYYVLDAYEGSDCTRHFIEWSKMYHALNCDNNDIRKYILNLLTFFPDLIKLKNDYYPFYSNPVFHKPISYSKAIDICTEMNYLLKQLCWLVQCETIPKDFNSLEKYNNQRREIGLEPVNWMSTFEEWYRVVSIWEYRIGGEKYNEGKSFFAKFMKN